jgi:acetoin utilization protein AcuB
MLAVELVTDAILPGDAFDTVRKVIDRMAEFRIKQLPIVSERHFLGLVSDDELIGEPDYTAPIGSLPIPLL